jgi:catechol 2,3-dioxygenase-like lactoylglutathione lyase family enzyme
MTEHRPRSPRIVGLDHVQLAMPPGREADARRFYGDLLGLREVAKPPELAGRGGCWFVGRGLALHLGVEEPFAAATKAHPGLLVEDLETARRALAAGGAPVVEDASGLAIRRCYTADPFGNRVELIDARDAGFSSGVEKGR